jgi:hypothetical protein
MGRESLFRDYMGKELYSFSDYKKNIAVWSVVHVSIAIFFPVISSPGSTKKEQT